MTTDAETADGGLTFIDYLRPAWRFKFVVALAVALVAVATYLYTTRETKVYQASTQLYVGPSTLQQLLNPGSAQNQSPNAVADQATFVVTPAIAKTVRVQQHLPESPEALLREVSASPSSTTDFVTITSRSPDPRHAAAVANGFALAYLEAAVRGTVRSAQASLRSVQAQLDRVTGGSAHAPARTGLRQQMSTLEGVIANPPSAGQQLAPAGIPKIPVSPAPKRDALFAGVAALLLGVIFSYVFDRTDRRVRGFDELESLFDLPVLANVPHLRDSSPPRHDPYGIPVGLLEPLRSLRVNLDMVRGERDAQVIVVTSALPDEGKSTIVRNLALSYRDAGARVAILEADLRRPVLAAQLGVAASPGLGEALARHHDLSLQRVPHDATENGGSGLIDVAVAGTVRGDPTVLFTSESIRAVLRRIHDQYDVVLIDTPPLLAVSDGLPLLGLADGVLLVARAGTVTRESAARVRGTIARISRIQPVLMLGVVANAVADGLASYYGPSYTTLDGGASTGRPRERSAR